MNKSNKEKSSVSGYIHTSSIYCRLLRNSKTERHSEQCPHWGETSHPSRLHCFLPTAAATHRVIEQKGIIDLMGNCVSDLSSCVTDRWDGFMGLLCIKFYGFTWCICQIGCLLLPVNSSVRGIDLCCRRLSALGRQSWVTCASFTFYKQTTLLFTVRRSEALQMAFLCLSVAPPKCLSSMLTDGSLVLCNASGKRSSVIEGQINAGC